MGSVANWPEGRSVLVVVAAPSEARAAAKGLGCEPPRKAWEPVSAGPGWQLVQSGVGKVNAAVAVALACQATNPRPIVLNVGVCGALLATGQAAAIRGVVVASESVYADEGALTTRGFVDMGGLGFPLWDGANDSPGCTGAASEPGLRDRCVALLRRSGRHTVHIGRIATVSTCSGTDASARDIALRTGAIAEAMEGAAIAHALRPARGVAEGFLEVRVVSNTTGDRDKQVWDLKGSLEVLTEVVSALRSEIPRRD